MAVETNNHFSCVSSSKKYKFTKWPIAKVTHSYFLADFEGVRDNGQGIRDEEWGIKSKGKGVGDKGLGMKDEG